VLPRWATNPGTRVEPNPAKKGAGFIAGEKPPAGEHNFLFGNGSDWIQYLDDGQSKARTAMLPEIDPTINGNFPASIALPIGVTNAKYLLACAAVGAVEYSYNGTTWAAAVGIPGVPVERRAFIYDSVNARVMLCHAGGIAYTNDPIAGAWTNKALPVGNPAAWHYDVTTGRGVVINTVGTVYFFTNITVGAPFTAATTQPVHGGLNEFGVAYNPITNVWVICADLLFYSSNGGVDWATAVTFVPVFDFSFTIFADDWLDVAFLPRGYDGSPRFVAIGRSTIGTDQIGFFESTDGITWTRTTLTANLIASRGDNNLLGAVAPHRLIVLSENTIAWLGAAVVTTPPLFPEFMVSFDGAATWSKIAVVPSAAAVPRHMENFDGRLYLMAQFAGGPRFFRSVG
jgi:hypothetical protein